MQCVRPEERTPQAVGADEPSMKDPGHGDENECPICLEPLSASACTLPCSHTFHRSCVEGLRSYGIKQACPMCRAKLPPGPQCLYEAACRKYFGVERRVDRGEEAWGSLADASRVSYQQLPPLRFPSQKQAAPIVLPDSSVCQSLRRTWSRPWLCGAPPRSWDALRLPTTLASCSSVASRRRGLTVRLPCTQH